MPKLNETFDNAQESTAGGGEFKRMDPGAYMCRIQAVRTEWSDSRGNRWTSDEKQYVKLILDIDEGEHAGEFSREYWDGEDKDWGHTLYMSWTPRALGILKHTLKALDEANPGFDSRAAFEADQWMLFIGKKCRVLWNGQERTNDRGYVNVNVRPDRIVTADENPEPKVELERGGTVKWSDYQQVEGQQSTAQAATGAAYDDSSIPF